MHVAMIIDEERLLHEHATLKRLAIGLIDEGIKLTRIVPDKIRSEPVALSEQHMALATKVEAAFRPLPWLRRGLWGRMIETLEKAPPDILYAVGRGSWRLTLELAESLDRPAAISIHSTRLKRLLPRHKSIAAYIAATPALGEALRRRVDADLVSVVPQGVAVPHSVGQIMAHPDESVAIAIIGAGRDVRSYRAMLEGLRTVCNVHPQAHAVIEMRPGCSPDLGRMIRRLDLQGSVSALEEASLHRALLTRCDLLLVPEASGTVNSIILECMGFGMAVIAQHDRFMDFLKPDETALVIDAPESAQWAAKLTRLLQTPEEARQIGQTGRAYVAANHSSSQEARNLAQTFSRIVRGETYSFSPAGGE
ncbi:MAG TPA: glycosyltransferase family 4 protein [Phycisphaerales bacterium]|nr:glycosyltransferase family 4 protein [Phycisphaerales bacterium]HRQ75444.1 glycosyltransferase family 4 protein [Phycisphaerales bacterium]